MLISTGDIFDDGKSIIIKRIISVGLSRSKSDVETPSFIRKRAHCKFELLALGTRGNC